MSSKTNYLGHCLELAERSPLHHRHGCVVVKGGRIIGKGFNKPSLSGGAFKTGALRTGASPSSVDAEMKSKHRKSKHKQKDELPNPFSNHSNPAKQQALDDGTSFQPFEAGGGFSNTPLTVHSEMAAIMDVLQKSTTLSSKALSCEKPPNRLPGSKRKDPKWKDVASAYVERFFETQCAVQAQAQGEWRSMVFNRRGRPSQANYHNYKKGNYYYYNKPAVVHSRDVTSCSSPRYKYEYERRDSLMEVSQSHRPNHVFLHAAPASNHQQETTKGKIKLCENHRVNDRNGAVATAHVHSNTTQSIKVSCSVRERMKHPQLRGADIYVARLGRTSCTSERPPSRATTAPLSPHSEPSTCDSTSPPSGSLHDELVNPHPRNRQRESGSHTTRAFVPPHATDSRPCYRCVEYMDSCGISRVFWTDQDGCWKRAKVRDLVSALRDPGEGGGEDPAVFITKHEVLLLRRLMERAGR